MTSGAKKLHPSTLKARVLKLADGTRTAAEIAAELNINPRQPVEHLHVLKKSHGITW
jgi:predicted ArsR family transcriptional regulator